MSPNLKIDRSRIDAFCRKWKIAELSLFGSACGDGFRPDSDVDLLVEFAPGGRIHFGNRVEILDELTEICGRPVDLVVREALRNPFRRHPILLSREVLYSA